MLLTVSGVSFLIHVYSVGYMYEDEGSRRYFVELNLFVFFMLSLYTWLPDAMESPIPVCALIQLDYCRVTCKMSYRPPLPCIVE